MGLRENNNKPVVIFNVFQHKMIEFLGSMFDPTNPPSTGQTHRVTRSKLDREVTMMADPTTRPP